MAKSELPLLLLDNASMSMVVNEGEFKSSMLTFEEAKAIVEMHGVDDVIRCFSGDPLETVVFNYLDIKGQHFEYNKITKRKISS